MTKFHTDGKEKPILNARAIAAAYWISYFAMHWLLILEVIERTAVSTTSAIYFLLRAIINSVMIAAHEQGIAR